MKRWIKNNLIGANGNLISKKCRYKWFEKYDSLNKLKIFDDRLTGIENMKLNGCYNRIFDCGNLKYEWKK